jgi:serine phosphatase RsbU (regulator of sigma subunit)
MSQLFVEQGTDVPQMIDLGREVFTIGRGTTNDLHFRNPWLSRLHARIIPRGEIYFLADAGSRNGTYLNGQQLRGEHLLSHGDLIALGDILLRFVEKGAPPPTLQSSLKVAESAGPLPAANTVVLSHDELELDRYRERDRTDPAAVGAADRALLPALARATSALIGRHDLGEIVEQVMDLTLESVAAERGALLLKGGDGRLDVETERGYGGQDVQISRTLMEEVLDKKQAVLTVDAQTDGRFEHAQSILLQGIRSIICVPLWNNREVIGLLYLDQRVKGRSFSENDLRVTGLIANLAAVKIENVRLLEEQIEKKRMEQELRLGAKIQRGLLPAADPRLPGYEICGENQTCFEIGGDYYDFIKKRDGKLAVVIGDIAGKGVGAALLAAVVQASIRALIHAAAEPAVLVQQLNEVLIENSPENKFSTLFYAELDPRTHEIEYVNAGHNPALLWSGGATEVLGSTGPLVGLLEEAAFYSRRVILTEQGVFLLYTDGISEPENGSGEEFGTSRLIDILREHPDAPGRELIRIIRDRLEEFQGAGVRLQDDTTVVVVRRLAAEDPGAGTKPDEVSGTELEET